ncbi:MAG: PEP-CTERM sorting domain-containing protein [Verrucomicrobia bacterium]|nr:PEP-CTERM sorting domain-containing protein [Verrucomicrobiota bacterium]
MALSTTALLSRACALALLAAPASAAVLFDLSNFNTLPLGNGANGANTSVISTGSTTFGLNANSVSSTLQLATPFTLGSDATISSFTFFAYSTSTYGNPPVSPFTGGTVSIFTADPAAGGTVITTSTTFGGSAFSGTYRVSSTTLTNTQRPVFSLTINLPDFALSAGTYYVAFAPTTMNTAAGGSTASVFTPPVLNADGSLFAGGGSQFNTAWAATTDAALGTRYAFPIIVNGTAVPEPSVMALGLVGLGALLVRARRRA